MSNNKERDDIADSFHKEQTDQAGKIAVLESKYDVVVKNTEVVIKLASKVSLLLSIMSFVVIIVSGGAIYTFTALSEFKDTYAQDRIALHSQIIDSQKENREYIQDSISDLQESVDDLDHTIDSRLDSVEKSIYKIQGNIDKFHDSNYDYGE